MPTNPFEPPKEVSDKYVRPDLRGLLPLTSVAILAVVVCSGTATTLIGWDFGLYVAITGLTILAVLGACFIVAGLLLRPKVKDGMDAYKEAYRRFAPHATSLTNPVNFYRFARENGCSKMTAMLLLRDLFGMNLKECMEVDACHANPPQA